MGIKDDLQTRNRVVALLPEEDRQRLTGDFVLAALPHKKELYSAGEPIDAVYFPLDCVVSLLEGAGGVSKVEMATIGNEGVVGAYSVLNPQRAIGIHIVQVPGEALRLGIEEFDQYIESSAAFYHVIRRYLFALTHQIVQAGACNRLHTMRERCARWLLMTHDRSGSDTFQLTQEMLAEMLAVRRATVNAAIGNLKTAGFIRYVRGHITVVDRAGLESAACVCYELIKHEYADLGLK